LNQSSADLGIVEESRFQGFGISQTHEHPNAPHPLALLRLTRSLVGLGKQVGEIVKHIDSAARRKKCFVAEFPGRFPGPSKTTT
jgi:hypothetical protein